MMVHFNCKCTSRLLPTNSYDRIESKLQFIYIIMHSRVSAVTAVICINYSRLFMATDLEVVRYTGVNRRPKVYGRSWRFLTFGYGCWRDTGLKAEVLAVGQITSQGPQKFERSAIIIHTSRYSNIILAFCLFLLWQKIFQSKNYSFLWIMSCARQRSQTNVTD